MIVNSAQETGRCYDAEADDNDSFVADDDDEDDDDEDDNDKEDNDDLSRVDTDSDEDDEGYVKKNKRAKQAVIPTYRQEEDPGEMSGLALELFNLFVLRKNALDHECACAAWQLSVDPTIMKDVKDRCSDEHKAILRRFVFRLHTAPCPNEKVVPETGKKVSQLSQSELWGIFQDEYHQFQTKSGIYADKLKWEDECVRTGRSHVWHRRHSNTTVCLGFTACHAVGKSNGIGITERVWGGVKRVKEGKASHMGAKSTKKRSVIYVSSLMDKARIARKHRIEQNVECEFSMNDLNFNASLLKEGVDVDELENGPNERIFRAYVEEWEEEARHINRPDCENMIMTKYGKMRFQDPDDGTVLSVWHKNCEWIKKKKSDPEGETWGWHVLCYPADKNPHKMDHLECFDLELVHDYVRDCEQAMEVLILDRTHGEE